jgi:transposase InsO family protein
MRIFNKYKNTKGFISGYNHILKTKNMNEEAIRRAKALSHWHKYGIDSAKDAFSVPTSTLYRWRLKVKRSNGHLQVLNNKSRTPHNTRTRILPEGLQEEIIRLRTQHPRMGKTQIYHTIKHKIKTSESTVGRVLKDMKEKNLLPLRGEKPYKKKSHVIKARREEKVGLEADTVVRHINGIKWYFVTAIDLLTRKTWVYVTHKHSSMQASNVMRAIDMPIPCVQTDNGSEFLKNFHLYCIEHKILHYFIYPNTPKMNAHIERFNRTLEEEFIMWNRHLMLDRDNLNKVNEKLQEYITYYNTIRPHTSLGFISPMEYYTKNQGKFSYVVN